MTRQTFREPVALYLVSRAPARSNPPAAATQPAPGARLAPPPQPWDARALAQDIYSWLSFDPARATSSTLGMPAFVYETQEPPQLPFGDADRHVVLVFSDDAMVTDRAWQQWAAGLHAAAGKGVLLLHVSLSAGHARLGMSPRQAILLAHKDPPAWADIVRLRVARAIARFLEPRGGKLFLSHAKKNEKGEPQIGHAMALGLKEFLESNPTDRFFDEVSVPDGELFEDEFGRAIDESTVVVLMTDRYATRYWCQWEVLRAKRSQRPLVIVDALETHEPRHFPHAANAPLLRWEPKDKDDARMKYAIVNEALRETLRQIQAQLLLQSLERAALLPAGALPYVRPPELATLDPLSQEPLRAGRPRLEPTQIVHPDPPLSEPELRMIERVGRCCVYTIAQALANEANAPGAQPHRTLQGSRIAVSISMGPLAPGYTQAHQAQLLVLLTRHLLAAGARVAYGGDLRKDGYTALLQDLVWAEVDAGAKLPRDAVLNTLPWPESLNLSSEQEARMPIGFEVERGRLPPGTSVDPNTFAKPVTVENRLAWTLALTEMRRRMTQLTQARVLVGGPYQSAGYFTGIVEEALRHMEADLPVYLIGAYGGVVSVIIDALERRAPRVLTRAAQLSSDAALPWQGEDALRAGTYEAFRQKFPAEAKSHEEIAEFFAQRGVAGLKNGLSDQDNRRLFVTRSPLEQVALVLRGLRALRPSAGPA